MQFTIPNYKIEELQKKINKIRNKGAQVTFDLVEENVSVECPSLGEGRHILCSVYDVDGTYQINGWRFVATIEHSRPENIIRLADYSLEGRIPERYRTASQDCEHCHIRRDRNDTYLVYNEDLDEWKQVGKTCLQGYTNGLNAQTCAELVSIESEIARLSSQAEDGSFEFTNDELRLVNSTRCVSNNTAKRICLAYVKANGFVSGETARVISGILFDNEGNINPTSQEEVDSLEQYFDDLPEGDWRRNAIAAWNKRNIERRDIALIASLCNTCLKKKTEAEARRNAQTDVRNVYIGEAGDKVEFTIASIRILYWREPSNYYASSYPVYGIVDTQGRNISWGCSSGEIELNPGDILKGTVKKQVELRNGIRSTEVTRCKVIGHREIGRFNWGN